MRAGVAHVAAHRLVGPPQPVGVEAQVQLDQPHHGVDVGGRVAQRLHARPRHARADHLVVVEAHAAVGDGARARLADVVEERGQAEQPVLRGLVDDGQGVGQHVLVPVDRVLLERQARQLGQELVGQAGAHDEPQRLRRHVDHDDLVQLVADALGRDDGQPAVHPLHRGRQRRVGLEREPGGEAGRPQHAQRVVAEGDLRVERRAQPPRRQVAQPVEGVDQLHVGQAQGQRVDGEVAPRQVDRRCRRRR